MIQKGIIQELYPEQNSALVRVPIYETSQGERALFTCILKNIPGIINGYKEEDVVFVDFENNDLDYPIIVGKLYLGVEKESNSNTSIFADNLNIKGNTNLSSNFTVGDISYNDIYGAVKASKDLYTMVNDLNNEESPSQSVSGTNDGINWTSLTINSDTYAIPAASIATTYTIELGTNQNKFFFATICAPSGLEGTYSANALSFINKYAKYVPWYINNANDTAHDGHTVMFVAANQTLVFKEMDGTVFISAIPVQSAEINVIKII